MKKIVVTSLSGSEVSYIEGNETTVSFDYLRQRLSELNTFLESVVPHDWEADRKAVEDDYNRHISEEMAKLTEEFRQREAEIKEANKQILDQVIADINKNEAEDREKYAKTYEERDTLQAILDSIPVHTEPEGAVAEEAPAPAETEATAEVEAPAPAPADIHVDLDPVEAEFGDESEFEDDDIEDVDEEELDLEAEEGLSPEEEGEGEADAIWDEAEDTPVEEAVESPEVVQTEEPVVTSATQVNEIANRPLEPIKKERKGKIIF